MAEQSWKAQLRELEADLARSRARWKIVIGHHPVRNSHMPNNTIELIEVPSLLVSLIVSPVASLGLPCGIRCSLPSGLSCGLPRGLQCGPSMVSLAVSLMVCLTVSLLVSPMVFFVVSIMVSHVVYPTVALPYISPLCRPCGVPMGAPFALLWGLPCVSECPAPW